MHFVFGGRGMGMLEYAKGLLDYPIVCDLAADGPERMDVSNIVVNVHLFVKSLFAEGLDARDYFERHMDGFLNSIVVGDEVGSGVVPVEPFERAWRDEVGRVYQLLAANARDVTRVWAGIPQPLKRDGRNLA
jgi:hypothetical protein